MSFFSSRLTATDRAVFCSSLSFRRYAVGSLRGIMFDTLTRTMSYAAFKALPIGSRRSLGSEDSFLSDLQRAALVSAAIVFAVARRALLSVPGTADFTQIDSLPEIADFHDQHDSLQQEAEVQLSKINLKPRPHSKTVCVLVS